MKIFSTHRSINILLLAGLILITISNIAAYRETEQLLSSNKWVIHIHRVIETIEGAELALSRANSEMMYYIISKQSSALQNHQNIISTLLQGIQRARDLTLDNPIQQLRLDKLNPLIKLST